MDRKIYFKTVLEWREKLYTYYTEYEKYIKILIKFIMAFVAFYMVGNQLHYQDKLLQIQVTLGLSLVGVVVPYSIFTLLVALSAVTQIYFLSPVLAGIVAAVSFVLYLMLIRYDHKSILAMVFIPIFLVWKIPFVIAIVLGLFFGPASILTAAGGVIIYYVLQAVTCMEIGKEKDITDFVTLAQTFMDSIIKNKNMYVMLAAMVAVVFVTWLIRTRRINYAFELAIFAGTVCGFLMLLLGNLMYDSNFSVQSVLSGSLLSGIIGYVVHFMHMVLDYGQTEEVQFEDEDYYYYVRAVPKLKMTIGNKKVKIYSDGKERVNRERGGTPRKPAGNVSKRNRR